MKTISAKLIGVIYKMYFSNITNDELQHFHNANGADFSISLTEILHKTNGVFDNKLFYIEDLGNNIFRVFPLFYCKSVISSNPADNVINSQCLILVKNDEHESYLSFMTNGEKSNVLLNRGILNIKSIGENLTLDEFNGFVYHLRRLGMLSGNLNYEEINNIVGNYGTYIFNNIQDQLKNDTGLIVNEKMKNNPVTIKLTDPFFLNAKYTLTCTVVSLTGANVCEEGKGDFINQDSFNIELVENTEIPIDVSNYINDSVLLFNVKIDISFNTPEIINSNFLLSITADNDRIPLGDELILTATLTGEDNVAGYAVQFFEDGELIGNGTTDENGVAVLNYIPTISTTHNYSCSVIGLTENINVVVYNRNTNLIISVDNDNIRVDNDVTLTGVLTDSDGNALSNIPVNIYENNVLIAELNTGTDGEFNDTITYDVPNNYMLRAEFNGGNGYDPATSNAIKVTVYKYSTAITLTAPSLVYTYNNLNYTVKLEKEGTTYPGQTIKIYNGETLIQTATTNNNGEYTGTLSAFDPVTYNLKAVYDGTDKITKAETGVKHITVRKIKTYLTCEPSKNPVNPGETINLTGTILDEFGNVMPKTRAFRLNGEWITYRPLPYTIPVTIPSIGNHQFVLEHNMYWVGDGTTNHYTHEDCTTSVIINCVKFPVTVNIAQAEYYNALQTIPIQVTSDDPNFNPATITVTFNGLSNEISTKDTNGNFIYKIPQIDGNTQNLEITAKYNGDDLHGVGTDSKTITVYNAIQNLTLSKSGSNILLNIKDKDGHNVPNLNIPLINGTATRNQGDPIQFTIENVLTDANGNLVINWGLSGTFTMQVTIGTVESNELTFTL